MYSTLLLEFCGDVEVRGAAKRDAAGGGLSRQKEQRREAEDHEGSGSEIQCIGLAHTLVAAPTPAAVGVA